LQALIAEELDRRRARQAEPDESQPQVASTPEPDATTEESDLQTLIARELQRRRQGDAEPTVTQPQPAPVEVPSPVAIDEAPDQTRDLRDLIAREVEKQTESQPKARVAQSTVEEADLQMLIRQELERRRQRAERVSDQQTAPFLVDAKPTTSGISSVTGLSPSNRAAYRAYRDIQAQHDPDEPWSVKTDLERYRTYAVDQGSRSSGESLKKALERIGLTLEDGANILTLGYASDRGAPFRDNDGKGFFQEPGNVPRQAGKTLVDFGDGLYSLVDLVLLDSLANKKKPAYQDNHPLVRPLVYSGKTVGGVLRTTEELGNAVTWGYFDNLTGSVGMCFEDIIEVLKHSGQAVTNVARVPVHMLGGKGSGTDKALDWVLLVPLEMASNIIEMQGFSNMDNYETAFAEKGVIGSVLEFGGSSYIVYRAIKELDDELNDDNGAQENSGTGGEGSGDPALDPPGDPTTPPADPTPPATPPVDPPLGPIGDSVFYWSLG
jgi:hypothetical protein